MSNHYQTLGIEETATDDEIKRAYKKLAMQHHPDRNADDKDAETKMKEINEAYQVLGDSEKRRMYDMGADNDSGFGFGNDNLNDILKSMGFNINFGFGGSRSAEQRMQVKHQVTIPLKDAVFGCTTDLNIPVYVNCVSCKGIGGDKATCHKCNGAGQTVTFLGTIKYPAQCVTCNGAGYVLTSTCSTCNRQGYTRKSRHIKLKIPAGIQNGAALRINPEKDDRCEVFILVAVMPHPKINRNGATLFSTETISCLDAMIGGAKQVETIDGYVVLQIPAGTQQGQQLVIEGHGGVLTNGRANHLVNVHIDVPTNLTAEQTKKIKDVRDKIKRSVNG